MIVNINNLEIFAIFAEKRIMRGLLLFILLLSVPELIMAGNQELLDSLDKTIAQRTKFVKVKEEKINSLKKSLTEAAKDEKTLKIISDLYDEYYVFQFDSALIYADRGLELARLQNNDFYISLFTIHRSEILAIGGLYPEAVENMNTISVPPADQELRFKYLFTYSVIYTYWSDYCNDKHYSPLYRAKADEYLSQALEYAPKDAPLYEYYLGEKNVYLDHDGKKARNHYLKALINIDESDREFSMASFALAGNYRLAGEQDKYLEYVIKAALCDLKNCTMENMALQNLALFLFEENESQIERAERYINVSMADAKFYNNRLRILEISRIMPQIMNTYQANMEKTNTKLQYSIIFISLLVLGLFFTVYYIYRQNRKLSTRRKELANSNLQLTNLNQQLADSNKDQAYLNEQLKELNQRLVDTNKRREGLASIYIDLCAKYIDKLAKYQTLVKRKIKANQTQELLQTISSTRISEEDAATFLHRFDKAFLELYPTFVEEFNALLQENGRIQQKSPHTLPTELRTFALIRLGVKSTADIAGLLFLSPQTIYNCRSVVKNKSVCKESFDEDVLRLCSVIK